MTTLKKTLWNFGLIKFIKLSQLLFFLQKNLRNLKVTNFPNNHIIDEGLGSMSRYVLIVVVEKNLIFDDLCKTFITVYSNFLYNAEHKFIVSYELDVNQMGHLQTHLQRAYDEDGWIFAKLVQVNVNF